MKILQKLTLIFLALLLIIGCSKESFTPPGDLNEVNLKAGEKAGKVTGSLDIEWKGGQKGSDAGNMPEELFAFIEFNAHEATEKSGPKGEVVYTVKKPDGTLHREIKADVTGALTDPDIKKAWVVAVVISDTKGCDGDNGGHEPGCDHSDNPDDGCSGDDSSHDGGCSHDEGDDPDEGGCSHEDDEPHEEGGCPGGEGGQGGPGGSGNPMSGKNCRLGQLIAMKMHDGGTPGTNGDGITWKWFDPEADWVPTIENIDDWPHLCKKTIIGGNLVVHK